MQHGQGRRLGFLFAGQGAQHPGMGQELYRQSAAAREVLDRLEALRPGTLEDCFSAGAERLKQTDVAQPCLFAVQAAVAAALTAAGLQPWATAGFSLGEVSAVRFAGYLTLEEGFALVQTRARAMADCAKAAPGGMLAVLRLDEASVEEICRGLEGAYPVNYNCPGQTVCAAKQEALAGLEAAVKQRGGRCLPLQVSGPFHSPYMEPAAEELLRALTALPARSPQLRVYANLTGEPYRDFAPTLAWQCARPVRWEKSVRAMLCDGAEGFVEIGPGKVLAGLVKKIAPGTPVWSVEDEEGLERAVEEANA